MVFEILETKDGHKWLTLYFMLVYTWICNKIWWIHRAIYQYTQNSNLLFYWRSCLPIWRKDEMNDTNNFKRYCIQYCNDEFMDQTFNSRKIHLYLEDVCCEDLGTVDLVELSKMFGLAVCHQCLWGLKSLLGLVYYTEIRAWMRNHIHYLYGM